MLAPKNVCPRGLIEPDLAIHVGEPVALRPIRTPGQQRLAGRSPRAGVGGFVPKVGPCNGGSAGAVSKRNSER